MIYRFNLEFNPMSLSNSATLFITVDLMNIIINVTSLNNNLKRLDHTGHTFVQMINNVNEFSEKCEIIFI